MPRRPTLGRRLRTATRWPVGVALTSWRYLWRTTPLHRRELAGDPETDGPPVLPQGIARDELQVPRHGAGPLFHRRYSTRIRQAELGAEDVMARIQADPDCVAPSEFASFVKVRGDEGILRRDDEFVVRMPGPWDGPVRVVDVTPTSFRLATLAGHLEAGQIEFRAVGPDHDHAMLEFTIESWARSGDRLSYLAYDKMRMAKEIQFHMWTSVLEHVADLARGRMTGGIDVETRRVEAERLGV